VELYEVVFAAVILGRFLVPLMIPVYPLPGILGAFLLDASDRAIYAQFVEIDVEVYQSYDKALDIYYLTLAYVATLRNWANDTALRVARHLWYYRLVGVTLFEVTGIRWLLVVFPNAFEYFFVYYEVVKTRWHAERLGRTHLLVAAAVIWVFIKIPQEYWVHVAQGDTTDFIKANLVGAPLEMPWIQVFVHYPWVVGATGLLIGLLLLASALLLRLLPAPERPLAFHADAFVRITPATELIGRRRHPRRPPRQVLLERVALVSLVVVIFGEVIPGWVASPFQVAASVSIVIAVNAGVSVWLGRLGVLWRGAAAEFVFMGALNVALVLAYGRAVGRMDVDFHMGSALFLMGLLTLIVTLHDRYLSLRTLRVPEALDQDDEPPRGSPPGPSAPTWSHPRTGK